MKDIIDSLKIRLNNPFIISFLLSWPLWNWQIIIGLVWYNSENLARWTGCSNYFDLVSHYSAWWSSLFGPLASALTYTFLFPLVKWGISVFNAWISSKEETQILELTKKGNVPTTRYIRTMKDSNEKILELSEIIKEESKHIEENNILRLENTKIRKDNSDLTIKLNDEQQKIKDFKHASGLFLFVGEWEITVLSRENSIEIKQVVLIESGLFEGRKINSMKVPQFRINNFIYNPATTYLSITFLILPNSDFRNAFNVDRLVFTEAMWVGNQIESTNKNMSKYNLRMKKIEVD